MLRFIGFALIVVNVLLIWGFNSGLLDRLVDVSLGEARTASHESRENA